VYLGNACRKCRHIHCIDGDGDGERVDAGGCQALQAGKVIHAVLVQWSDAVTETEHRAECHEVACKDRRAVAETTAVQGIGIGRCVQEQPEVVDGTRRIESENKLAARTDALDLAESDERGDPERAVEADVSIRGAQDEKRPVARLWE
jgi:hypothetical protein